jgi:predicted GTPase
MNEQTVDRRVIIMGAAGRDFHVFNTLYSDNPTIRVVAFTAAQIPGIAGRRFPPTLAGPNYPEGIPIVDESELEALCRAHDIDDVVCAYSDLDHRDVMHLASRVLAAGARFILPGAQETMLRSERPVIAISAVRTGCGKSQTSRHLSRVLKRRGLRTVLVRHPMPYGDLTKQAVQRFESMNDLEVANCTIEEREEYEPHIQIGNVVFAGVDYEKILRQAENEADVVLWDGGNNDFPFFRPDLHIVVADALRPHNLESHHPGEAVLRMADIVVINKVHAAEEGAVEAMSAIIKRLAPNAPIVHAASPPRLEHPDKVSGKRVLIVEDGPTITHGGMAFGAGYTALRGIADAEIIDPRDSADTAMQEIYRKYGHIGPVLPATGYSEPQRKSLANTINQSVADVVVAATPADLSAVLTLDKPVVRVTYDYSDTDPPRLSDLVDEFLDR